MSDFIFSKSNLEKNIITRNIQEIYQEDKPNVIEFHGEWGSLGVSYNLYSGFKPYENDQYIVVIIGGPLLTYRQNNFLNDNDSSEGTEEIFQRWKEGRMEWDEDLAGPFVVFIVNKETLEVTCVTDLMSFIPVYTFHNSKDMIISTHVDALARISEQNDNIDTVSEVDFIVNGVVTYPYTLYYKIFQIAPATEHKTTMKTNKTISNSYWIPNENIKYTSIKKAADELRQELSYYIKKVTDETSNISQFISGGEDSRTLSALLKKEKRDAFIFLDDMNREGKVAKKTASIYGARFNLTTRHKLHYLSILPGCSDLVGSGSQYHHAHTYGFHNKCKLDSYSAIFGGLFSDALFKGARIKKVRLSGKLPFFPEIKRNSYSAGRLLKNPLFKTSILLELAERRQAHLKWISEFRNESAEEWFELWPSSMNMNIPNLHANRRLFRSYEPFMSNKAVKISAAIPQKWKLNRRFFHKMAKPLLKDTKWLRHGEGWFPYYSWVLKSLVLPLRLIKNKIVKKSKNQGPWGDWDAVITSEAWAKNIKKYSFSMKLLESVLTEKDLTKIINSSDLTNLQRVNFLQTLYMGKHYKRN